MRGNWDHREGNRIGRLDGSLKGFVKPLYSEGNSQPSWVPPLLRPSRPSGEGPRTCASRRPRTRSVAVATRRGRR
jgi:hypothetical protein